MTNLFTPIKIRELEISNRIWLSPMCQYSAVNGVPNEWHFAHLAQFAMRKVGLLMTEATAISPLARSTRLDTGIWNDEQVKKWLEIVRFVHGQGSKIGIQLWHSGQKASTTTPWQGQDYVTESDGGWRAVAPSAIAFGKLPKPKSLTSAEIDLIILDYQEAAKRAQAAEFDVLEIHGAHGYLIHSFLSPISNHRSDKYGGSFENRTRFVMAVVVAIRKIWPSAKPLFLRTSSHDWVDGGWTMEDNLELARILGPLGVDLIDCSSGGIRSDISYPVGPSYQVGFSEIIKKHSAMLTCAVGIITSAKQANEIVVSGKADAVMLGREFLRNPNWVLDAAEELKDFLDTEINWPDQYKSARQKINLKW